jgi:hypothetical protein
VTPELEHTVVEALRRADWWLSLVGFNRYGVLVKDDVPDFEEVRGEVRAALAAYDGQPRRPE